MILEVLVWSLVLISGKGGAKKLRVLRIL